MNTGEQLIKEMTKLIYSYHARERDAKMTPEQKKERSQRGLEAIKAKREKNKS